MVSIRIPNLTPRVQQDPRGAPQFTAPGVVPQQNAQPQQMQQLGEGLQQLGAGAMRAGDYLTDVYNDAKATTWKNQLREGAAAIETEAAGLQGVAAMEQLPGYRKRLADLRESFADKFENAEQERMFSAFADVRLSDAEIRLNGMLAKQTAAANIGAQAASMEGEIVDYQNNWQDPVAAPTHKANALAAVNKRGDLEGWTPEQRKIELLSATTRMHAGVLDSLENNPAAMKAYFDQNKGEMTPQAKNLAQERIDRAERIAANEKRDATAWTFASKLAESGASQAEQRAVIDQAVQGGKLTADEALKTWSLAQSFADQKWQDLQRERTSISQQLEQLFAKNPSLEVDNLPAKLLDTIDTAGMRGEAFKIHREVRENRIADMLANGTVDSLVLSRDVRSMTDISNLIDRLSDRYPKGDAAKTPEGLEKTKRLDAQVKVLTEQLEALATRPRVFVRADDLPAGQAGWFTRVGRAMKDSVEAVKTTPTQTAPKPQFDMKKFTEELRKSLYPDSGR